MTHFLPAGGSVTTMQMGDQMTALELRDETGDVRSYTVMPDDEAMELVGQIGATL